MYQVLFVFTGDLSGDGYLVVNNLTGDVVQSNDNFFTSESFEVGTGYSYSVLLGSDTDCGLLFSSAVVSCTVTSVELIRFKGSTKTQGNLLQWTTASEDNSSAFIIEKSKDGQSFEYLTQVAAQGNSNTTQNYQAWDKTNIAGTQYYRLLELDKNGKQTIVSNVIALNRASTQNISIAPIPATDNIQIQFETKETSNAQMSIFDITGKSIDMQSIETTTGDNQVNLNIAHYPSGTYFLQITNGQTEWTARFVKD